MSVTISVENNIRYCKENGLANVRTEPCLCVEDGREVNQNCHYCNGTGRWEETIYPFEMNLANANFGTLWSALGLARGDGEDYCGSIEPGLVADALARLDPMLLRRATRHYLPGSEKPADALFQGGYEAYDFGIGADQAEGYVRTLTAIVAEAQRRKALISWG